MIEIKIKPEYPYVVDGFTASRMEVHGLNFMAFAEAATVAQNNSVNDSDVAKQTFRERVRRQVRLFDQTNKQVAWTQPLLMAMPLPYALQVKDAITNAMEMNSGVQPEILSKGDGVVTPIHVRLGTPINIGKDKAPIQELEILAKTLGDLEDAVVADNRIDQAKAVLAIARPIGPDTTLTALPSWALDQITVADGLWLMAEVIAPFMSSQREVS